MPLSDVYRVQVQEVWSAGRAPDPETYWLDREEAITLLDSVLEANARQAASQPRIGIITVTPFWELQTHDRIEWSDQL